MGRRAEGWKLRRKKGQKTFTVRFVIDGEPIELSTGKQDSEAAAREAARIYSEAVQGTLRIPERKKPARSGVPLDGVLSQWLDAAHRTLGEGTIKSYLGYAVALSVAFPLLSDVTPEKVQQYLSMRLRSVQASTARKELSALRGALEFAKTEGLLLELPTLPGVPKRVRGTRYEKRRRVRPDELSPAEVRKLIAHLPEWSRSKKVETFPVRARFVVAYETGLRPALLDVLSVPENYSTGADYIRIEWEDDKGRNERIVPLSEGAKNALDSVCPERGIVFGKHDYRPAIRAAAKIALPEEKAARFTGCHLRSARLTHWLEQTANLAGVQYLAGHKHATTTAKYVRPSLRAAMDVLKKS